MKRTRTVFGLAVVLTLVLTACPKKKEAVTTGKSATPTEKPTFAAGTYMADLQAKGKIVIGVKFDIPQFGYLNPTTNKSEGFDVDIGNIIADRLDVDVEFVEAISANRIPFLKEDKVDLIISTMTINEERKKEIDFSIVYYLAQQRLLVAKDSKIEEVEDLDTQKAKVCSAEGSTSEKNIRIVAPNAVVELRKAYSDCFALLQNKQTEAVSTDDVILTSLLSRDPDNFRLTGRAFSKEPYGVGIKKGRVGFKEFIDDVISDIKKDGTWKKFYDEWVKPMTGESASPPPDDVKAEAPSPSPSPTGSP